MELADHIVCAHMVSRVQTCLLTDTRLSCMIIVIIRQGQDRRSLLDIAHHGWGSSDGLKAISMWILTSKKQISFRISSLSQALMMVRVLSCDAAVNVS